MLAANMTVATTIPQTALVTGAVRRIGRAIALDLAHHGWAVGVHYGRSKLEAESVVAEIRDAGGTAAPLQADLSVEAEVQTLVPRATDALGPVGLLVNNAAAFENDSALKVTRASWDKHMETNLRAPFVLSQVMAAALQDMIESDGIIINILDQRVRNLTPNFISYTLSKAGLWTLTRTLAMALAPRIRVNAIGPGPTLRSDRQSEEQFQRQWQAVPLQHGPSVAEICDAIRFLIAAPSVTGQMIAVDGGENMGWAQPSQGIVHDE
jgi:NAD(P)-dependent dehydrogenase (short-subunit alcohol dehydrogenase family)